MTKINVEKHYVSILFLFLFLIRILLYGASIGDSIALFSLILFVIYSLYIHNKNRDIDAELSLKIDNINQAVTEQKHKLEHSFKDQLDILQNELNALRQQVGLIKVDQGFQKPIVPQQIKVTPNEKRNTSNDVNLVEISEPTGQVAQINLLQDEINKLKQENLTLKKELDSLRRPKSEKLIINDETVIAELQLARLKEKAFNGELTLEEIKKYDLLVKNKKLSEGNPTVIADYKKLPDNVSDDELVLIASTTVEE